MDIRPPHLVPFDTVCERFGFSHSTCRRLWQAGEFPAPLRICRRKLFWLQSDLCDFIQQARAAAIGGQPGHQEKKENENAKPVAKPASRP
jgi:predicted DNA-binding transcriptional regulator AlpA